MIQNLQLKVNSYHHCVIPENIHTPPQKELEIPRGDWRGGGGGWFSKTNILSKCMKLDWNFQRSGAGLRKNPFRGGGIDNFWNHTLLETKKV